MTRCGCRGFRQVVHCGPKLFVAAMIGMLFFVVSPTVGNESDATIHAACRGWSDAFHAAAQVYQRKHADVEFRFDRHNPLGKAWLDGSLDLYATYGWLHHSMGGEQRRRFNAMPGKSKVDVIGHTPVVALVHPDNPIEAITIDQLRLIRKMARRVPWRELGWDSDGFVTRWIHGVFESAWALSYDRNGQEIRVPSGRRIDPNHRPSYDELMADRDRRAAQKRMSYHLNEVLEAVADDPQAIAIVTVSDEALASGLKMLAVRPNADADPVAMTPAAVAFGKYPVRMTARLYVHPDANEATRQFVAWLKTDAGQAVLARHQVYNRRHAPKLISPEPEALDVEPREPWVGPIEGAAALLPTKMVSPYFLMARPEHQDFYEQATFDAIAADGRLELVDRQRLDELLRERELQALNPERNDTPGPIVAADVFVLPSIITHDDVAYLRIVALHAPTAAVLDALDVPLDPKQPTRFDRPLAEIVKEWWPRVLSALHAARTQPRWHMMGFSANGVRQVSLAEGAFEHLRDTLRSRPDAFCIAGSAFTATHREVAMQWMGLSRDRAGGFAPLFDYVVEGRQVSSNELSLVVRNGRYEQMNRIIIQADDTDDRLARAGQWLGLQVLAHRERMSGDDLSDEARQLVARVQSRMAWNAAVELGYDYIDYLDQITTRFPSGASTQASVDASLASLRRNRYGTRYWTYRLVLEQMAVPLEKDFETSPAVPKHFTRDIKYEPMAALDRNWLNDEQARELARHWMEQAIRAARQYAEHAAIVKRNDRAGLKSGGAWSNSGSDAFDLTSIRGHYWRQMERAAQLDPTWERAAYKLTRFNSRVMFAGQRLSEFNAMAERFAAMQRFLKDFPESEHHESVLFAYARHCLHYGENLSGNRLAIPPLVDRQRLQQQIMDRGLWAFFDYLEDYVLADKMTGPYMPGKVRYQHYWHGLAWVEDYMHHCEPGPDEVREIVADWSRRFDAHPTEAPHSDFLRLVALGVQEDHDAFFDLLADLQRRWPEPRKMPWSFMVQHSDKAYPYRCAGENVAELLGRLDRSNRLERDFRKWLKGELETAKLPWNTDSFDLDQWREQNP